jgi:hypothetical protein
VSDSKPEPVSLTVHRVEALDANDPARRTRAGRLKMLLVLAVCAAPVVASYLTYFVIKPQSKSNYGTLITPVRATPELALTALDGRAVPAAALKGQWLLVVVSPSRCEAACEKQLFMQRQLREMLGRERDRIDKVWFITDAGAIAPAQREAVESAPGSWLLRADRAALSAWLAPEAGHALEDHLYLVDPRGDWMMRMPASPEPARVKRDLDRLLRAAASWDRAGR